MSSILQEMFQLQQSENGRLRRYLIKKQKIFTQNNPNPNSDHLSPQYNFAFTIRANGDALPGDKKIW